VEFSLIATRSLIGLQKKIKSSKLATICLFAVIFFRGDCRSPPNDCRRFAFRVCSFSRVQLKMAAQLLLMVSCVLVIDALSWRTASTAVDIRDVANAAAILDDADSTAVDKRSSLMAPRGQLNAVGAESGAAAGDDSATAFRRFDRRRYRAYRGDLGKRTSPDAPASNWDAGQLAALLLNGDEVSGRMRLQQLRGEVEKRRSKFRGDLGRRQSWTSPCDVNQVDSALSPDCIRLEMSNRSLY
jgi:hypothetical protein